MKFIQYIFLLLAISNFTQAQEMVTDRPDATESAQTVPLLHFQIESGFTTDRKSTVWDEKTFETLVRFGLHSDIELRFAAQHDILELFGNNYKTLANEGYVNGGLSYSLLNNLSVDAFYGMGINNPSSDHFFVRGFSLRLPR